MNRELPTLPEGFFFRVEEGWFFGPTVRVELRREHRLGPLRWSTKQDRGWSTQELMECDTDEEVAARQAEVLAHRLAIRLRPVELGGLAGDHRPER